MISIFLVQNDQVFSVLLVIGYFWTTLIAIIVLYIFIYQVALNLEKKSRDKHRKITSLVGCSATNTLAVALPPGINLNNVASINNKKSTVDQTLSSSQNSAHKKSNTNLEECEETDSNSKLSKGSFYKHQDSSFTSQPKAQANDSDKPQSKMSSLKANLRHTIKGASSANLPAVSHKEASVTQRKASMSYLKANHVGSNSNSGQLSAFSKKSLTAQMLPGNKGKY